MRATRAAPLRLVAAGLLALAASAGCATPSAPPPLRVGPAEFAPIAKLCLLPIESDLENEQGAGHLQDLLRKALEARRFETVDTVATRSASERLARELGGYYEVDTGEPVERFDAVTEEVRARLGAELGCQALVQPHIAFVIALWNNAMAHWDGADVGIGGGFSASGTIGALSLHVRVFDLKDRELFFGVGGIRPTAKVASVFSGRFEPLPDEELLADDVRNRAAIELALHGLPSAARGAAAR